MWSEPPRLRKQVAQMLLAHGHEVHFFEKRRFGRRRRSEAITDKLTLHTTGHLLHHQLKIFSLLNSIDASYLKSVITKQVQPRDEDIVVNFCYDFYFLRDIFPDNPMVHVVNDDYISAAIRPHRRSAKRLLHRTARSADHNLVVSYLIERQIREATDDVSLFFPWARHGYELPVASECRDEVLYWGYINERIDEQLVSAILESGIRINFVGTVTPSRMTDRILSQKNAVVLEPQPLEELSSVLARCSCAIIPYDITNPYNPAVTISNRGFELMSFGLPLLFSDMPNLIRAPENIVYRCKNASEFIAAIEQTRSDFDDVQTQIRDFLVGHTVEHRYEQFMSAVQNAAKDKIDRK